MEPPDDLSSDSTGGSVLAWGSSATHAFDDLGKPIAGVGKAVEVVLALAAAVYDSPVPQQGQVAGSQQAGLMLNWSHNPPTCRSPSESRVTTWSRVGSLTCLSRIAARCMVFVRSRVSF